MDKPKSPDRSLWFDRNLQIVFAVTLMAVMGVASIAPAFPRIIKAFEISSADIAWLITVFTLPGIVLTPVTGILSDRYGRKKILGPSLILFGIAGVSCAFADTYRTLIILRFFQGVGAASLGAINVTIIGDLFSGKRRAEAMGYNASVLSVGTAAYPALGGALAMMGWYFPFLFPVLAIPVGFIVLFKLKNPEPERSGQFGRYLKKAFSGMLNRKVIGIFILSISTFVILYGAYLTLFPLYLSEEFGASTLVIGLMSSAMSVTTAITSTQLGRLVKRFSEQALIITGFALYAISLVIIPLLPGLIYILIPALIFGLAQGLNIPSLMSMLASLSPMEYRGAFMSVNGMVLRTGQTLGPVIIGGALDLWNSDVAFYTAAAIATVMIFGGWFLIRK